MRALRTAFTLGVFCAGLGIGLFLRRPSVKVTAAVTTTPAPLTAHLYRFEIQPNGQAALARWLQFERDHHGETLATLEDEAMYFEGVFPDDATHPQYLYWVAVNGTPKVGAKPKAIDAEFDKLESETLVKGSRTEFPAGYVLVPPFLQQAVREHSHEK